MSKWVMFSSVLHSQRRRKYWSLWHGKQPGNYTGMLQKKEILFHNTKLEKKAQRHPVLPGCCFEFNLFNTLCLKGDVGFRALFNSEHLWGRVGSLEMKVGRGGQEGINKGFLLSMERKIKINEIWFHFAARGMPWRIEVPPARSKAGLLKMGHSLWFAKCPWVLRLGWWCDTFATVLLKLLIALA